MGKIIGIIVVIWLVIGAIAAGQRGYYSGDGDAGCADVGAILVTIVAGPLNYLGVNPQVDCELPAPSE